MNTTAKLGLALLAFYALFLGACNDELIEPGPFQYPIQLEVSSGENVVNLNWTKASVSTFTEYVIVRSIDSIPDTQEPVLEGNQVIVERIDKIDQTTFDDFKFPISDVAYYKVYADIGDRFLMTQTIRVDLNIQTIPFRVDVMEPDPENNEIVCYDRGLRVLFTYDYEEAEVLEQASIGGNFNSPLMQIGEYNGAREIYLSDRNSLLNIYDRNSLSYKAQMWLSSSSTVDFHYSNGQFVMAANHSGANLYLYDRSTLGLRNTTNGATNNPRYLIRGHNTSIFDLYEFTPQTYTRYTVHSSWFSTTLQKTGSAVQVLRPARHPERDEFIVHTSGQIINSDLELVDVVGGGSTFFNMATYTADGKYIATARFLVNEMVLEFYDTEKLTTRVKSIPLNFNPNFMFADGEYIYATGLVFTGGTNQTVISKFRIPS